MKWQRTKNKNLEELLAQEAKQEMLRTQKPPRLECDEDTWEQDIYFEILHSDWGDRD